MCSTCISLSNIVRCLLVRLSISTECIGLPVGIHCNVVAAQKRAAQMAIVPTTIGFVHGNHNQATFGGLNVFGRRVTNLVATKEIHAIGCRCMKANHIFHSPSLVLGVMIPGHLLILQHFGYFDETAQMNTLAIGHHNLLFQHTRIANVTRFIGHILQM